MQVHTAFTYTHPDGTTTSHAVGQHIDPACGIDYVLAHCHEVADQTEGFVDAATQQLHNTIESMRATIAAHEGTIADLNGQLISGLSAARATIAAHEGTIADLNGQLVSMLSAAAGATEDPAPTGKGKAAKA